MGRSRALAVSLLAMSGMVVGGPDAVAGAEASGPLVDVALSGVASADSALDGHSAGFAVDGDGATSWCPAGAHGSVLVDLGRYQRVEGFGVTLMSAGTVRVDAGMSPSRLRTVASSAPATGTPTWLTGTRTSARYVRLTVTAAACVGELRVLGRAARSMVLGDDLSFAVQEAAIGNVCRDRGAQRLPERILAAHGANYVRLRLWNEPPGGYSNLDSVLAMARRASAAG